MRSAPRLEGERRSSPQSKSLRLPLALTPGAGNSRPPLSFTSPIRGLERPCRRIFLALCICLAWPSPEPGSLGGFETGEAVKGDGSFGGFETREGEKDAGSFGGFETGRKERRMPEALEVSRRGGRREGCRKLWRFRDGEEGEKDAGSFGASATWKKMRRGREALEVSGRRGGEKDVGSFGASATGKKKRRGAEALEVSGRGARRKTRLSK